MRCRNHNRATKVNFDALIQLSLEHPVFYVPPTANTNVSFPSAWPHPAICCIMVQPRLWFAVQTSRNTACKPDVRKYFVITYIFNSTCTAGTSNSEAVNERLSFWNLFAFRMFNFLELLSRVPTMTLAAKRAKTCILSNLRETTWLLSCAFLIRAA